MKNKYQKIYYQDKNMQNIVGIIKLFETDDYIDVNIYSCQSDKIGLSQIHKITLNKVQDEININNVIEIYTTQYFFEAYTEEE